MLHPAFSSPPLPLFQPLWAWLTTQWPLNKISLQVHSSEKVRILSFRNTLFPQLDCPLCELNQPLLPKKQSYLYRNCLRFRCDLQYLPSHRYSTSPRRKTQQTPTRWLYPRSYHHLRRHHLALPQNTSNSRQKERWLIVILFNDSLLLIYII